MLKRLHLSILSLTLTAGTFPLAAQATIHLDAVSIKENQSGAEPGYLSIPPGGNRIVVSNSPMFRIIGFAFNKQRNDLIDGLPAWTRDLRWDVEATISEDSAATFRQLPFEKQKEVLQQILQDRCGLVAHTGKKEAPVYALTVSKSGAKIKDVPPERKDAQREGWDMTQSAGKIEGRAIPMEALIYALSKVGLERQVIDRTGLTGRYDISLSWSPDDKLLESQGSADNSDPSRMSLFTAMQDELGLKMEATKADVDAVIVTHIDKPSRN